MLNATDAWGAWQVAWSPDRTRIAADTLGRISILDAQTGIRLRTFDAYGNYVRFLAWSPDGKRLATAGGERRGLVRTRGMV